jgi:hypothetical protein
VRLGAGGDGPRARGAWRALSSRTSVSAEAAVAVEAPSPSP